MPYVSIDIVAGHPEERKSRIARNVAKVIMEETGLPPDAVWIVFRDIPSEQWFVGEMSVRELDAEAESASRAAAKGHTS